jgi:hypothetical protein
MTADMQSSGSQIAAFSKWEYPHPSTPDAKNLEKDFITQPQPPGSNDELIVEFFTKIFCGRMKWIVPETNYCPYSRTFSFEFYNDSCHSS